MIKLLSSSIQREAEAPVLLFKETRNDREGRREACKDVRFSEISQTSQDLSRLTLSRYHFRLGG